MKKFVVDFAQQPPMHSLWTRENPITFLLSVQASQTICPPELNVELSLGSVPIMGGARVR